LTNPNATGSALIEGNRYGFARVVDTFLERPMAMHCQPISGDERRVWDQLDFFYKHGLGYAQEMANRPQTLYGIEDSPVGLAAWTLDHDASSQALIARGTCQRL
jgi:hypothetical protein